MAQWRRMQDVNAMGPFLCTRAVAPHMRKQQYGRVVNITSGTAFKGAPFMLDYVSSKGAVMTMTRALARELGKDFVTVNAVSPGYTLSEGNLGNHEFLAVYREAAVSSRALPRDGWPADIVGAVAFLASDDASFISGQILAVDGGSVYH
ncbi:(S)-1-Phenylethanol dehydrogenase [compost metagenome]